MLPTFVKSHTINCVLYIDRLNFIQIIHFSRGKDHGIRNHKRRLYSANWFNYRNTLYEHFLGFKLPILFTLFDITKAARSQYYRELKPQGKYYNFMNRLYFFLNPKSRSSQTIKKVLSNGNYRKYEGSNPNFSA